MHATVAEAPDAITQISECPKELLEKLLLLDEQKAYFDEGFESWYGPGDKFSLVVFSENIRVRLYVSLTKLEFFEGPSARIKIEFQFSFEDKKELVSHALVFDGEYNFSELKGFAKAKLISSSGITPH